MRILFITSVFPYPPHDGDRVRSFNLIKSLSEFCTVDLACLSDNIDEWTNGKIAMSEICSEITVIAPRPATKATQLRSLLTWTPAFVTKNWSDELLDFILGALDRNKYDVVHLDGLPLAQYYAKIKSRVPVIIDLRDSWTQLYRRKRQRMQGADFLSASIKLWIVSRYERCIVRLPAIFTLLTEEDREVFQELNIGRDVSNVLIVPNGVDTQYFAPSKVPVDEHLIMFSGAMDYFPNGEAVEYFIREIFPKIQSEIPNAKLRVVGRNPSEDLLKSICEQISFTGYVDDIRTHLREAAVVVCPLLTGAGMKNKMLEAFAMQKPVVATSIAAEGIGASPSVHFCLADNPDTFARCTVDFLRSRELCEEFSKKGRHFVETQYSWASSALKLLEIYNGLAEQARQAPKKG